MGELLSDSKDWTWVVQRRCPQCGLDAGAVDPAQVADRIRANAAAWPEVLGRADVRDRPTPTTWSPLEYACHVRDVFVLFDQRLQLMLEQDDPLYPNWDQDATAVEQRYAEADPAVVTAQIPPAAEALAARLDGVTAGQWSRPGRRSDGAHFTIATFAQYLLHDPVHHLHDVSGLARPAG